MGDNRKNAGGGDTPPGKGRPGMKPVTAPKPAAVEAAPAPVAVETPAKAPSSAAVEAAPAPVAVETPAAAPSSAAVDAAPTPVVVETPAAASSAMMLARGAVAVAAAEGDVMTLLESDVPKTVLHCGKCHGPLKPPVYQCSRMHHVACSDCGGGGGECRPCADMAASAVYVQSAYLDTLFGYTKVACPYKKYGCASSVAYRDAAAHAAACACAPCSCSECLFEGSPADLVRHLTEESGRHAWTAHKITYGKDHRYVVDELKLGEDCQKLLVAEEDDGVFILDIDRPEGVYYFVALVCVRNKAAAGPVYSSSVALEGPPAEGLTVMVEKKVVAADLGYGIHEALPVHPGLLHGEQTKKLHLCICISKTQSISA